MDSNRISTVSDFVFEIEKFSKSRWSKSPVYVEARIVLPVVIVFYPPTVDWQTRALGQSVEILFDNVDDVLTRRTLF